MNKKILLVAIGLLFVFTAFAKDCPQNSTLTIYRSARIELSENSLS